MMRCEACKLEFPDHLINPLVSMEIGKVSYPKLCPICALETSNQLTREKRTAFDGPIAERLHQEAKAWLAKKGGTP
jgi:hypothetical protein